MKSITFLFIVMHIISGSIIGMELPTATNPNQDHIYDALSPIMHIDPDFELPRGTSLENLDKATHLKAEADSEDTDIPSDSDSRETASDKAAHLFAMQKGLSRFPQSEPISAPIISRESVSASCPDCGYTLSDKRHLSRHQTTCKKNLDSIKSDKNLFHFALPTKTADTLPAAPFVPPHDPCHIPALKDTHGKYDLNHRLHATIKDAAFHCIKCNFYFRHRHNAEKHRCIRITLQNLETLKEDIAAFSSNTPQNLTSIQPTSFSPTIQQVADSRKLRSPKKRDKKSKGPIEYNLDDKLHDRSMATFKCNQCNTAFAYEKTLKMHTCIPATSERHSITFKQVLPKIAPLTTRILKKNLKCDQCGKNYSTRSSLSKHKKKNFCTKGPQRRVVRYEL